jgi:hypothetical protein
MSPILENSIPNIFGDKRPVLQLNFSEQVPLISNCAILIQRKQQECLFNVVINMRMIRTVSHRVIDKPIVTLTQTVEALHIENNDGEC